MTHKYTISEPTFNTDVENISCEFDAIKTALAITIFNQPHETAMSIIKSIKSSENQHMQKLYNELIQFSPANGVDSK